MNTHTRRHDLSTVDITNATWRKSSASAGAENCVEVADLARTGHVGIRDSKHTVSPVLLVPAAAWTVFVSDSRSLVVVS